MMVVVQFDPRSDVHKYAAKDIVDYCLSDKEAKSAGWRDPLTLVYRAEGDALDVIDRWMAEDFNIDEFVSFRFEGEL